MKIVTWNVNGLRACMGKGFPGYFNKTVADIFCIQETKLQRRDIDYKPEGYYAFWNDAERKGYAGTAVFSREKPQKVSYGISEEDDSEGRVITLEYGDFYLVNVYVPNSGEELKRLGHRMKWNDDFREYLSMLDGKKPVIACGDFNVAHQETDIKNASSNRRHAGFTDEEREKFTELLGVGFIDSFRWLYPDAQDSYTYWSYRFNARNRNAGWRIDYGCISERLKHELKNCILRGDVYGSDHCPVELIIF